MTQQEYENRIKSLENDLFTERAQRTALEQVAIAHEKRAETAERALRMIEAGTTARPAEAATPPSTAAGEPVGEKKLSEIPSTENDTAPAGQPVSKKRRWWQRGER